MLSLLDRFHDKYDNIEDVFYVLNDVCSYDIEQFADEFEDFIIEYAEELGLNEY